MFRWLPLLESRAGRWDGLDIGVDLCLWRGVLYLLPTRGGCLYPHNLFWHKCQ
jgi:hypothetical protein